MQSTRYADGSRREATEPTRKRKPVRAARSDARTAKIQRTRAWGWCLAGVLFSLVALMVAMITDEDDHRVGNVLAGIFFDVLIFVALLLMDAVGAFG